MRAGTVTSDEAARTIEVMAVASETTTGLRASVRPGALRIGVALTLAVVALMTLSATIVLTIAGGDSPWWLASSGAVIVPAVAGALIALYRPANLIGWLLLVDAVDTAAGFLSGPFARYGLVTNPGSLPGARWALLWNSAGWPALFAGLVALVYVFPNGRLPSRRWRRIAVGAAISFGVLQLAVLFEPQHYVAPYQHVTNPLPTLPGFLRAALTPFWFAAFASLFVAAWAVRVRFRRAVGIERLQLLWLTYGALLIPLALVACLSEGLVGTKAGSVTAIVLVAALTVIPAAIGLAVFRYRLFDIELILSRTLVYATLTTCVVAAYIAFFALIDDLIDARGVAGVAAAGVVALGFQPARVNIQRRVHRLVYGDRADPYGALARLGQRLQAAPEPGEVFVTIVDDVTQTLRLGYCAVTLNRDGVKEIAAERGRPGREPQYVVPLSYQGNEIGELIAEPAPQSALAPTDRHLLDDLARQAGAAVHSVRLMSDLQRSRERLIAAREEERLRLRRDLHDGLGPTLAALVFKIGLIRDSVQEDPELTDRLLRELSGETRGAIDDIRGLVYALRPPALDELGLVGALREQAALLSEGAEFEIDVASPDLPELPPAVEVAAYRIATEALTNVVRHAQATQCHALLRLDDEELTLEVVDDGVGPAAGARMGIGLRSMRERASELGGTFEIVPGKGRGTWIRVRLPVTR
jgi:two-component system, NarL family, sensor kinase